MPQIELIITPLRSGLLAGHDTTATALIRVRAPAAPDGNARDRSPLNLAIVIDRSGSMQGRPLAEAKRCAEFVVGGLALSDTVSVVAYDNRVDVLAPSHKLTDRNKVLAVIRSITEGGSTALFDGWRLGADQALFGHTQEHVSRVLLLSDGNANHGLMDPDQIASKVAHVAEQGVSTSTYGLGHHFNEHLMMEMARAGQGNGYYGESVQDLMDPFQQEFDLLNSLCARRLSLSLEAADGVEVRLLNRYEEIGQGRWRLPDLAYGGEAWALAELRIPADLSPAAGVGEIELLRATLELAPLEGGTVSIGPERLTLPFMPAGAYEALTRNDLVKHRIQELRAAELQERARIAAYENDWDTVERLLAMARAEAEGNQWVEESLGALENYARRRETRQFAKEAHFSSARMSSRLVSRAEKSGEFSGVAEMSLPSFLRRKREQGKRPDPNSGDDAA